MPRPWNSSFEYLIDVPASNIVAIFMEVSENVLDKVKTLLNEEAQRDPYKRFTILSYQLADVGKCMRYMEIYPDDRKAQAAYFKTAMADLMVQVIILAERYKLDLGEIAQLGADRLDEFRRKG